MSGCHKCGNTNEWAGYLYGFCDPCAKSVLTAAAKRYARKAKTVVPASAAPNKVNKKLTDDLTACERAIAALASVADELSLGRTPKQLIGEPAPSPETLASWRETIDTATKRYTRALTDHRLLWSMYRRADKSAPYYDVNAVISPIGVGRMEARETPQAAVAA